MDVAVAEIGFHCRVAAVVGVLMGEHSHLIIYGVVAGVLHDSSASGPASLVIGEGIVEREVLEIETGAGVEKHIGQSQSFLL